MKTLYQNTCPAWHDTRKISKDKWLQNSVGLGVHGTAKRVVYTSTSPDVHDTKNITIQKINQTYCSGIASEPGPDGPGTIEELLVYWKMEENQTTRQDSHTGNHDLTDSGPVLVPNTASGKILNAALFDADPDKILSNSESIFNLPNAMTISTWVYLNTAGPDVDRFVLGKWSGLSSLINSTGYCIVVSNQRFSFIQSFGASFSKVDSGVMVSAGQWHHVVCGFNGSGLNTIFIQVNNESRQFNVGLPPPGVVGPFRVGSSGEIFYPVNGRVDETGVWLNRALDTDYVTYLWNGGTGRTYPFT